jgi:hypothetical protein
MNDDLILVAYDYVVSSHRKPPFKSKITCMIRTQSETRPHLVQLL